MNRRDDRYQLVRIVGMTLLLWVAVTILSMLVSCTWADRRWGSTRPVLVYHCGKDGELLPLVDGYYINSWAVRRWLKEHPEDRLTPCPGKGAR